MEMPSATYANTILILQTDDKSYIQSTSQHSFNSKVQLHRKTCAQCAETSWLKRFHYCRWVWELFYFFKIFKTFFQLVNARWKFARDAPSPETFPNALPSSIIIGISPRMCRVSPVTAKNTIKLIYHSKNSNCTFCARFVTENKETKQETGNGFSRGVTLFYLMRESHWSARLVKW